MKFKIILLLIIIISIVNFVPIRTESANPTDTSGNVSSLTIAPSAGGISFSGSASPEATVFFMENGQVVGTTQADSSGLFNKTLAGLSPGIHNITVYATDVESVNTIVTNYSISVAAGLTTFVSGLILPPSFSIGSAIVPRPAKLIGHGLSLSNASTQVFVSGSRDNITLSAPTNNNGQWSINLNPKLHLGQKTAYVIALDGHGGQSGLSEIHNFSVVRSSDLNVDNLVNLADVAILMLDYKKSPLLDVASDINDNEVADMVDFSIMMSDWSV